MRAHVGLTLVELLSTIAIVAIIATVGVPAFSKMLATSRLNTERDRLLLSLYAARSAAIMRRVHVSLCPGDVQGCSGSTRWEDGWIVFEDPDASSDCADSDGDLRCDADGGAIIRMEPASDGYVTIRGNTHIATGARFNRQGYAQANAGTFSLCYTDSSVAPAGIVLSTTGRARSTSDESEIACN